ncbi:TPA_exp: Uncharacterized protein A8136_3458 [Trichophyton benhamiae CBS 112371]|uniref:Uncharacterized protein n=2 Tax=Trichophyton TaxID=5550 RepID=D4B0G5_ARTBC|nr:uncharacterized protein ARB_01939 [Trichophyton benhamiae CBS 112371]EFE31072.1 conserved hypothetical protein [Trichophyton benhamiae CBS 112371]OAL73679.1 hypothetical protein A7D00_1707 [Trichophyton violaceum]DAA74260.1 TPA_exp: Uncharacterized protein A8136_3458 [Trichophyton benhamiae CBS 112371]
MAPTPESIAAAKPSLTSNDSAVLQALFDAESSPSNGIKTDSTLPQLPNIADADVQSLKKRELDALRPLQTTNENLTPEIIQTAIAQLSGIIEEHPNYAPAYLNLAQAIRLSIDTGSQNQPDGPQTTPAPSNQLFDNLAKTIALLTPSSSSDAISPFHSRILANAHTHRAYILYKAARSKDEKEKEHHRRNLLPLQLQDVSDERLEELASYDFQIGGRCGNEAAKQMAVGTNPYAKMCGAIVKDAIQAEIAKWNESRT